MFNVELNSRKIKYLVIGLHIFIWLLVIQIFFDLGGLYYSIFEIIFENEYVIFDEAFLIIPSILTLFYFNLYYLIPKYLNNKRWIKYSAFVILSMLIIGSISIGIYYSIIALGFLYNESIFHFFEMISSINIIVLLVSFAIGITKLMLQRSDEMKELRMIQKEKELHFLQAQIQPHFLFNTLNTIYSLAVKEGADKTTESVLSLSELMRYGLEQNSSNMVSIKDEVKFIENYIDFQRIKLGVDYPIIFLKIYSNPNKEIMAMCLIPLVENAFKYGVSQMHKSEIIFDLVIDDNGLEFRTRNKIIKLDNPHSHKIGLNNLKQRLSLMYNDNFQLDSEIKDDLFTIRLKVPLK